MRRPELYLLALVLGLGGFVVVQAVRTPRPATASTPGPDDESSEDTATLAGHVSAELRRTSTPPPVRDVADIRRRIELGAAGTYIGDLLADGDSLLTRWPERSGEPLRVWIEPAPGVAAFNPEYPAMVRQAFDEWGSVGIPMRFTFVVDTTTADVEVTWVDSLTQSRIGSTKRIYDQHGWIMDGAMVIATHAPGGMPLDASLVRATALHEIGHLLGIGHSADSTTIMSPNATGRSELAPADRATLRLLYALPPGSVK